MINNAVLTRHGTLGNSGTAVERSNSRVAILESMLHEYSKALI